MSEATAVVPERPAPAATRARNEARCRGTLGQEPRTAPVYKPLAVAVARAHRWEELLEQGRFSSINELADAVGVDRGYVGRLLNLTLLAPDIVEMILDGREPSGLSLRQLNRIMPLDWDAQRRVEASFRHPDSRNDGHP